MAWPPLPLSIHYTLLPSSHFHRFIMRVYKRQKLNRPDDSEGENMHMTPVATALSFYDDENDENEVSASQSSTFAL